MKRKPKWIDKEAKRDEKPSPQSRPGLTQMAMKRRAILTHKTSSKE